VTGRKIQQILHSAFGFVQDDKRIVLVALSLCCAEFFPECGERALFQLVRGHAAALE
jgi:hypothetical protein